MVVVSQSSVKSSRRNSASSSVGSKPIPNNDTGDNRMGKDPSAISIMHVWHVCELPLELQNKVSAPSWFSLTGPVTQMVRALRMTSKVLGSSPGGTGHFLLFSGNSLPRLIL